MREDEIYVATKIWFRKFGYVSIAGQPPSGCDNIPTVEIKDPQKTDKGSKGSFKPDLVVANSNHLVIVECKPGYNSHDEMKLLEIDANQKRLLQFYDEIDQRGILLRRKLLADYSNFEIFSKKVRYCLAHSGRPTIMRKVLTLSLLSVSGEGYLTQPSDKNYAIAV
jgi:hypothetical protein